jgi:two-component system sensor histidine kinase CpxA
VSRRSDEIGQLARDFDTMAERLERMVGSQRRLIRDVSHELRSPLARLQVALELARDRSAEGGSRWLDRIELEASRLDHLIGQQLVLARLEAGVGEVARTSLRLDRLAEEVVAEAALEAEAVGSEVHVVASCPLQIEGNEDLLRSALDNVVRNAIRFTAEGTAVEVRLEARPDPSAGVSPVGDQPARGPRSAERLEARLVVRDHGPGVPEASLDELLEPFFRVEEARDRRRGGSGLGLAIAARAVRLHGGVISAANADGGGLEVRLLLPGVRAPTAAGGPAGGGGDGSDA